MYEKDQYASQFQAISFCSPLGICTRERHSDALQTVAYTHWITGSHCSRRLLTGCCITRKALLRKHLRNGVFSLVTIDMMPNSTTSANVLVLGMFFFRTVVCALLRSGTAVRSRLKTTLLDEATVLKRVLSFYST